MKANKFNKLTSFALSLVLTVGILMTTSAEESLSVDAGAEAYAKLTVLGVIGADIEYDKDREISRGEFTHLIMELTGYPTEALDDQKSVFADVTRLTENAEYIAAAYSLGYIGGNPNGNFEPNRTVTCAEGLKLLSGILGYGIYAEQSGGFPTGYYIVANRLRLLKGLNLSADSLLDMGSAAVMLANAAETDLLEFESFGSTVTMKAMRGKNLLTERFSIYKTTAVIDANEYTKLLATDSDLRKGTVRAGGMIFDAGNTNAAEYLGVNMELYYYDNALEPIKLLYIAPVQNKNDVLELNAEDILEFSGNILSYSSAEGKTRRLQLASDVVLIWNGKMAELTEEKVKPEVGTVTFISNDGDSVYDVIKVMSYKTYVVSAASEITGVVSTKQGTFINLDATDSNYYTIIKQKNQSVGFDAIQPGQTLSYAESENNGKVVKNVLLSDKTIMGSVETVNQNEKLLTVDGKAYKTTVELAASLKPGREGTFYLDIFDRIIYLDGTLDIVYGYLNGLSVGTFGDVKCRIFTENNRWGTLEMNNRVRYNGVSLKAEAVAGVLGTAPNEYRQLIRYLVNSDGKITVIDTAEVIAMGTQEDKQAIESDIFRLSASGRLNYRSTTQTFNGQVSVSSDAKLFVIPDQTEGNKEDGFLILGRDALQQDAQYTFEAYDANAYRASRVFILKNFAKVINTTSAMSNMMLVQGTGQMLNGDGEIVDSVNGYWQGRKISLPVSLSGTSSIKNLDLLNTGDFIQFSYNNSGEIENIERKYGNGMEFYLSSSTPYNAISFVSGKILAVNSDGNRIILQYSVDGAAAIYSLNATQIYIYDKQTERLASGNISDLMEGDLLVASARYLVCKELFIIRD